jgi:hypothetical protein
MCTDLKLTDVADTKAHHRRLSSVHKKNFETNSKRYFFVDTFTNLFNDMCIKYLRLGEERWNHVAMMK